GEEWKNPFRSTFRDENPMGLPLHHHRKPPPFEVERNLVALGVVFRLWRRLMQNNFIQWTADTGLELTVQGGKFQRALGWIPKGIERTIERHGSRGERSRFIAAKHIQTAQVLNRGEMLDDDLLPGHSDGAFRKRHRRNHGQELGCQANRQRHRKHQRLQRIAVTYDADDKQEENEEEDRSRNELAEISQALIEGG